MPFLPFIGWLAADLYFILSVVCAVLFSVIAPDLQKELKLSHLELGFVISTFFISYGLAQGFFGAMIDRFGPSLIITGSAAMSAFGLLYLSHSQNITEAFIALLIAGIGFSSSYVGVVSIAAKRFSPNIFGALTGLAQTSANVVTASILLFIALTGSSVGFRAITRLLSVALFALSCFLWLFLQNQPRTLPLETSERRSSLLFLRNRHYWLATLYFCCSFGVLMAFANLWNVPMQMAYGYSIHTATSMNAMIPLGGAFGAVSAGLLADRLQRPITIARLFIAAMLFCCMFLLYGPLLSAWTTYLLLLLFGFSLGGAPLGFVLVSQHVPASLKGTAFGLTTTLAYLFSAALQYTIGVLLTSYPAYSAGTLEAIAAHRISLTPLALSLVAGLAAVCLQKINATVQTPQTAPLSNQ